MKPVTLAVSAALLTLALPAQGLARAFPDRILAYASCAGGDAIAAAGERLGTVRLVTPLLTAMEQKGMLAEPLGDAAREIQHGLRQVGFAPEQIRNLLRHPFAIGFGPPTMFGSDEEWLPSLLLAIEAGAETAAVAGIVERAFGMAAQAIPDPIPGKEEHGGVAIRTLQTQRAPGTIAWAQADGLVLVSNSLGLLRDGVSALRGQRPALGQSQGWQLAHSGKDRRVLIDFFANPAPLWQGIAPLWPYEFADIADAFGVGALDQISFQVSTDSLHEQTVGAGASSRQDFRLVMPLAEQGALRALFAAPHDGKFARYCDAKTLFYFGAHLDFDRAAPALMRAVQMLPAEARREIERELSREVGRELRHVGMDLRVLADVLHAIGPELAIAVAVEPLGVPVPTVTAFTRVDDPAEAGEWLRKMITRFGLEVREVESNGGTIYTTSIPNVPFPVSPSFAFDGSTLILSSQLSGVRGAFEQAAKNEGGLAQDPAFTKLIGERPSVLAHARLNEATAKFWGVAEQWIPVGISMAGLDPALGDSIPMREDAIAALDDYGFSLFVTETGIRTIERGPFGLADLLFGAHAFLDHALAMDVPPESRGAQPKPKAKKKIF